MPATPKPAPPPKRERPPAPTVREQLEQGMRFDPAPGLCLTCHGHAEPADRREVVDGPTSLGPHCWVGWRWSSVRERRYPEFG